MGEDAGFIEAILAAPKDDVPRLVYADWLDDHGDHDRGEIIRVQCELARLRHDDERVSDLQAREYRLLSRHLTAWRDGFRDAQFRRGFIEQLQFWRPEQFTEAGLKLFGRHPVRDVEIGSQDDPGWGDAVAACPHLGRVELLRLTQQRCHFTDFSDFLAILCSPHLTSLRGLDASGGHGYGDNGLLELLGIPGRAVRGRAEDGLPPSLRGLCWLSLNEMGLTDAGLRALVESPLANSLTHLDLSENTGLTVEGIRALIDSPLWARLEELDLSSLYSGNGAIFRLLVNALPRSRITKLGLKASLSSEARRLDLPEALAAAPSWGHLEALDLSWNSLGSEGLRLLMGCTKVADLKRLDLAWNGLTDSDVEHLAACPHFSRLTSLRLEGNDYLGDAGMKAIALSPYLTRLVYLNVETSQVRNAGAVAFARSPNASRLRVWVLPSAIGDVGLRAIAESPHLSRLTTLLFAGSAGGRRGRRPTDAGALALARSANLPNLALVECGWEKVAKAGMRALLKCERLAWHGRSDLYFQEQAYQERFGDFNSFDLVGVDAELLFPWAAWA